MQSDMPSETVCGSEGYDSEGYESEANDCGLSVAAQFPTIESMHAPLHCSVLEIVLDWHVH